MEQTWLSQQHFTTMLLRLFLLVAKLILTHILSYASAPSLLTPSMSRGAEIYMKSGGGVEEESRARERVPKMHFDVLLHIHSSTRSPLVIGHSQPVRTACNWPSSLLLITSTMGMPQFNKMLKPICSTSSVCSLLSFFPLLFLFYLHLCFVICSDR